MNFFTLAVKNLQRRRGRTGLTILGVAIAIAVLFILVSFTIWACISWRYLRGALMKQLR